MFAKSLSHIEDTKSSLLAPFRSKSIPINLRNSSSSDEESCPFEHYFFNSILEEKKREIIYFLGTLVDLLRTDQYFIRYYTEDKISTRVSDIFSQGHKSHRWRYDKLCY